MKINPRHFPTILIVAFVLFLLVALLAGLRPSHGGRSSIDQISFVLSLLYGGVL